MRFGFVRKGGDLSCGEAVVEIAEQDRKDYLIPPDLPPIATPSVQDPIYLRKVSIHSSNI